MNKIARAPERATSQPGASLADRGFRAAYMAHSLRAFLADQIRALRGDMSQKAFGALIGKPQSVVSRLEHEDYGKVSLQTLIDIAEKLDIALIVRFTDFPAFVRTTEAVADADFVPEGFELRPVDQPSALSRDRSPAQGRG